VLDSGAEYKEIARNDLGEMSLASPAVAGGAIYHPHGVEAVQDRPVSAPPRPSYDGRVDVHLVDGTYELFRHYYAVPKAHDAQGREIGAVRGVVGSILG
jgi:hypothetical protein